MDNQNRVKINVTSGDDMSKPVTPSRVPTEPHSSNASHNPPHHTPMSDSSQIPGTNPLPANMITSESPKTNQKSKKRKRPLTKQRKFSIAALVIGLVALAGGVGFFAYRMIVGPSVGDAEYLVKIGAWQREDATDVVWDFTDIGHGSLTTNDHTNDYDFTWALEGNYLKIDTDWLYTLNNSYSYTLDQSHHKLELKIDDKTVTFVPASQNKSEDKSENNSKSNSEDESEGASETNPEGTLEDTSENTLIEEGE